MNALLNVSVPVFGLIFCGYLSAKFRILGPQSSEALNSFVYYFALPALLFIFVARAPVERIFYLPFLAAWGGGLAITFILMLLVAKLVYADGLGVMTLRAMNSIFANTGYMGIPLVMTAYGESAALPAIMATVTMSVVFVPLIIILLEIEKRGETEPAAILRGVAEALVQNPIVIPVVLGVLVSSVGLSVPAPFGNFADLLGNAAGPCALFAMGMFAAGQSLRSGLGETGVMTVAKLIVHPLVTWVLVTRVFEMDHLWAVVTVVVAALPTGATCFVLAQRYGVFVVRDAGLHPAVRNYGLRAAGLGEYRHTGKLII
ncbi:MAG: AEC family transporter [Gammaproteobacteria bacterium]|nr:AEC family transporter [Gammaproteobacteria bacterium]